MLQGLINISYFLTSLLFASYPSAIELKSSSVSTICSPKRLAISCKEAGYMDKYDYLIVNDSLERAVDQVHNIIQAEHFKVSRNTSAINEMKNQLKMFERSN